MDLWLGQVSFGHTPKHKWPRQFGRGRVSDEGKCCFLVKVLTYEHRASLKITPTFSEDGAIFAYGLSKSGSDWFEVHFKNVETGENYPEVGTTPNRRDLMSSKWFAK